MSVCPRVPNQRTAGVGLPQNPVVFNGAWTVAGLLERVAAEGAAHEGKQTTGEVGGLQGTAESSFLQGRWLGPSGSWQNFHARQRVRSCQVGQGFKTVSNFFPFLPV